jgi:hypothetical protein
MELAPSRVEPLWDPKGELGTGGQPPRAFPFVRPQASQRSTGRIYKMSSRAGGTPQGHVCVVVGGRLREPSLYFLAHDRALIDHSGPNHCSFANFRHFRDGGSAATAS